MKIGFIGLGNVGAKLAGSLLRNGFDLCVRDVDRAAAEGLLQKGASWADSGAAMARRCDVVITCLPSPAVSAQVMEESQGVLEGLGEGKIWLEMSSTDADEIRRLGALVEARGAIPLDCPVSGGCHRAATGNIAIFAGGKRDAFEKALPLLTTVGRDVLHTGELGSASIMKVATNYLAGVQLIATGEAFMVAKKAGIELTAVFQGILDALSGTESRLSAEEMSAALQSLEQGVDAGKTIPVPRGRFRGYRDDFAALNAKREGVVTLPSGVQYEILRAGTGRQPVAGDAVLVNYQGSLTTGAVFDTTYEDNRPARMQVDEVVVPGLKEALLLMPEGAKWRVVIPPSMGFARSGNNQLRRRDLIYDIELLSVESAEKKAAVTAADTGRPAAATGDTVKPPVAGQP